VPAILVSPAAVTKTKVIRTVIKDGFQNLETIQKSLPNEKWPQQIRIRESPAAN
jgi:hypothetical protein